MKKLNNERNKLLLFDNGILPNMQNRFGNRTRNQVGEKDKGENKKK